MKKEIEMMRVLRVPPLGKLEIEANGERYGSLTEVTNPKIRQRILAAIGELVNFCGGYQVLEDAGMVPQLTPTAVNQVEAEEAAPAAADLLQQQEAFLAGLQQKVEDEKNKPVKGRRGRIFSASSDVAAGKPMVEISETGDVTPVGAVKKPLSIAEQINEILQKHIAQNPSFANRGIRLQQSVTGGLQILVDGRQYETPADIEDKEVQALIKLAVKEWNSR
ncbi:MAG: hypothetical protein CSB13_03880 [Chloroflexi bacterium]|nr:MAG: hypothetical protein CSB13_03880 [Chloroflexota bacterium]